MEVKLTMTAELRPATVSNSHVWSPGDSADLWISCNGYESRSIQHLGLPPLDCASRLSVGYRFPSRETAAPSAILDRIDRARVALSAAGFQVAILDDDEFDGLVRDSLNRAWSSRPSIRVVVDISSMNRSRIASVVLACGETLATQSCQLDVVYFPSTFASHRHGYEPLSSFGPVHTRLAGWPRDPDLPLALVMTLGTEPRRADGLVELLEPQVLAALLPHGIEGEFDEEIVRTNERVLEVANAPLPINLLDPEETFRTLVHTVESLRHAARVLIVPLGPKLLVPLAVNAALRTGEEVGVWKASAGSRVEPIDVHGADVPVVLRLEFPSSVDD